MAVALGAAGLVGVRTVGATTEFVPGLDVPVIEFNRMMTERPLDVRRVTAAVESIGARAHAARYATLPMTAYEREGQVLMRQPGGWRVPMGTLVLSEDHVRETGGPAMAEVLAAGKVLMGEDSARIRDARVGDVLVLRDSRNRPRRFTVGMLVSGSFAGGEDLVMSARDGISMGVTRVSHIDITGFPGYRRTVDALRRKGFAIGSAFRVRTSWGPRSPDSTLGLAELKRQLGEFAFRPTDSAAIHVQDSWRSTQIDWFHRYEAVPLRNNCHKKVVGALENVFKEIVARGLRDRIDYSVSQRYGGCYVGRYNRLGGNFGSPSRHAFGAAIDLNTTSNPQWARPTMDCDVVRIFRKWGCAWGGNFWTADGMHFEWVG